MNPNPQKNPHQKDTGGKIRIFELLIFSQLVQVPLLH